MTHIPQVYTVVFIIDFRHIPITKKTILTHIPRVQSTEIFIIDFRYIPTLSLRGPVIDLRRERRRSEPRSRSDRVPQTRVS